MKRDRVTRQQELRMRRLVALRKALRKRITARYSNEAIGKRCGGYSASTVKRLTSVPRIGTATRKKMIEEAVGDAHLQQELPYE